MPKANDAFRTDPERLAAARRYVEKELEVLNRVEPLLAEAYRALAGYRALFVSFDAAPLWLDEATDVNSALTRLRWYQRFLPTVSETYYGNLAAFGVGLDENGKPLALLDLDAQRISVAKSVTP